jgi:hypothetical protein
MKTLQVFVLTGLIFSQFALVANAQDSESQQEPIPVYVSANAQRLCQQIAGMTIEQAVDYLNKSQMSFSLKKCSVSKYSTYQQGNIQQLQVPAPPLLGNYHPSSPRGGFYGR